MIELAQLRRDPDRVASALGRRGVAREAVDATLVADTDHRTALQRTEQLRAEIKALSRAVGELRRAGDVAAAANLADQSRQLGVQEADAAEVARALGELVRERLLDLPNVPEDEVPDGLDETGNVELRRWWPGIDNGAPFPTYESHQRVPHWEIATELGLLDLPAGARLSGSMFPLYCGDGARLERALTAYALNQHEDAYVEIRPPTLVLTETMTSTGHLPKNADDMYAIERDGLWAIPTGEVPLTSMRRDEILELVELPVRYCAYTACFRREAGAAGRDTRGLLRSHEFDKVELFAYCAPDQAEDGFNDILARAEAILRDLQLAYRVVDLCCGDLGTASQRTYDLEVYAPGVDQWLEVSSVSRFGTFQARRANVRYRTSDGTTAFVQTINGSALAWSRVWPTIVETYRQPDGSVRVPDVLVPFFNGRATLGDR
jgi:seryl-tRNA synthetase